MYSFLSFKINFILSCNADDQERCYKKKEEQQKIKSFEMKQHQLIEHDLQMP